MPEEQPLHLVGIRVIEFLNGDKKALTIKTVVTKADATPLVLVDEDGVQFNWTTIVSVK